MDFTLAEAKRYAEKGKIEEWVIEFLLATDNTKFVEFIKKRKEAWSGPKEIELDAVERRCGPEKGMQWCEPEDVFNKKVNEMISRIKKGWGVPPFILWYMDGELIMADGAHRHEALKRLGYKKHWAIIWSGDLKYFR